LVYSSNFSKDMTSVLFVAWVTGVLVSPVSGAAKCGAADKVGEAFVNNGFEKSKCGTGAAETCCHPSREVCITGTPKGGKEAAVCSKTRALYGTRLTKVIIIPVCIELLLVFLIFHMVKSLKAIPKPNRPTVAILCVAQAVLAMIVALSELWKFALYSAFLNVLVFHAILNQKQLPKLAFGAIVALQFFNVLAMLGGNGGATNGVFLPLGVFAADGGATSWTKGMIDSLSPGEQCSNAFEKYFHLESVEIGHEGHDPEVKFHGLCTDAFIASVMTFVTVKMVIQFIMTALCAKLFAAQAFGKLAEEKESMA